MAASSASGTTRWGLVGTGWLANAIVGDFAIADGAELVAVCSRSDASGAAFSARYSIPRYYSDLDEMLAASDIDVIYIATPHSEHARQVEAAIRAGKSVVCEKAFTLTAAGALFLQELAVEHGVFLMEAMWMKFNPTITSAIAAATDGELGQVRSVQASFGMATPYDADSRMWSAALGGGSTLDQGIYGITLAVSVLGLPDRIHVVGTRFGGVDADVAVTFEYDGGASAVLQSSLTTNLSLGATIGGTEAALEIEPMYWNADAYSVRRGVRDRDRRAFEIRGRGYVPMIESAQNDLAEGRLESSVHPMADTMAVMRILDEVRGSLGG